MSGQKAAFPFGRLTGLEEGVAARAVAGGETTAKAPRPRSAGPGSRRWRGTPRVPRTFESVQSSGESSRLLGPKHASFKEKAKQLLEQDKSERQKELEQEADGLLRRRINEERMRRPNFMTSTRAKPKTFSEFPLLGTSESAITWYMQHGTAMDGH
ncbi:unnamed protein product [Symbiodinium natans]|uniref:Uncharacterized protein n=1 Tax=Symbiodinium natans TaxID=878477 RepID=A0A812MR51_9DINO|nr:unnamed protein product [Symbiodinium natans]